MGCEVYANGDEIACKAGDGKVIAAFPDPCLSPPASPATPMGVPVPYPDSSFSKDMKEGGRTVKIKGKEVMLKDKSFYKSSPLGNEAATDGLGKGLINHVIKGKTYFVAWSMDVKFEDQNVDRHTDLTTSNHASPMANESVPGSNLSSQAAPAQGRLFCECCGSPPHSPAQAFGDEITEEQYYTGTDITPGNPGPFAKDAMEALELIRESACKDMLPPKPPTNDPCAKYYRTSSGYAKAARRKFSQAGADPLSNPNSLPHIHGKGQLAHRVPLNAGGCPTGAGNLAPVEGPTCQYIENVVLRDIHSAAGPYNPAYVSPPGAQLSPWITGGF